MGVYEGRVPVLWEESQEIGNHLVVVWELLKGCMVFKLGRCKGGDELAVWSSGPTTRYSGASSHFQSHVKLPGKGKR